MVKKRSGEASTIVQPLKSASRISTGLLIVLLGLSSCTREYPSRRTPIHLNPNMDSQEKYLPQSESRFFADSAAMRLPVPGTVGRGQLREDLAFYLGRDESGAFVDRSPVRVDMALLDRGQERYDIYCSPCHSRVGDGRGIMVDRGYLPPPDFHSERLRGLPDGQLFDVISNGVRNMPSYRHQVPTDDRWAIVAYLRALQRTRNATIHDVPPEMRGTIDQSP